MTFPTALEMKGIHMWKVEWTEKHVNDNVESTYLEYFQYNLDLLNFLEKELLPKAYDDESVLESLQIMNKDGI